MRTVHDHIVSCRTTGRLWVELEVERGLPKRSIVSFPTVDDLSHIDWLYLRTLVVAVDVFFEPEEHMVHLLATETENTEELMAWVRPEDIDAFHFDYPEGRDVWRQVRHLFVPAHRAGSLFEFM